MATIKIKLGRGWAPEQSPSKLELLAARQLKKALDELFKMPKNNFLRSK